MDFKDINRMDVCLNKMEEMIEQFEEFVREVQGEIATRKFQEVEQTQLQVASVQETALQEHAPDWLPLVWEHLLIRVPWRKGSKRITVPFLGWEAQVYASDLSKLKDFRGLRSQEIAYALDKYQHPRIQWCRPGNKQLCRIRDEA